MELIFLKNLQDYRHDFKIELKEKNDFMKETN
jgi:hypothetical protein